MPHCRAFPPGARSEKAVAMMVKDGYTSLCDLEGGFRKYNEVGA